MTTGRLTAVTFVALLSALVAVPRVVAAQKLSDAELKKLSTSAATAADHKKLAAHYREHATEHEADAKLHEAIVAAVRKQEQHSGHAFELALGATHYAEHSREAAEALRELVALHEGMAEAAAPAKPSR